MSTYTSRRIKLSSVLTVRLAFTSVGESPPGDVPYHGPKGTVWDPLIHRVSCVLLPVDSSPCHFRVLDLGNGATACADQLQHSHITNEEAIGVHVAYVVEGDDQSIALAASIFLF